MERRYSLGILVLRIELPRLEHLPQEPNFPQPSTLHDVAFERNGRRACGAILDMVKLDFFDSYPGGRGRRVQLGIGVGNGLPRVRGGCS